MMFDVDTAALGVVEAWSIKRLPFEPAGWLVDFRRQLAAACRGLVAAPGQILHAAYSSPDRGRCDVENVLTYNLGTAAIRAAASYGLVLERRFTAERGLPHHYRYEVAPATRAWTGWLEGQPLGTLRFTAELPTFSSAKAGAWWLPARHGDLTVQAPSQAAPEAYLVRLTIDHQHNGAARSPTSSNRSPTASSQPCTRTSAPPTRSPTGLPPSTRACPQPSTRACSPNPAMSPSAPSCSSSPGDRPFSGIPPTTTSSAWTHASSGAARLAPCKPTSHSLSPRKSDSCVPAQRPGAPARIATRLRM
ncbi:MAG: hypothetical protein L0H84_12635 [Pseudonocardia sp.]|nr:hypothetical protein [Pseudonocardia sp.]